MHIEIDFGESISLKREILWISRVYYEVLLRSSSTEYDACAHIYIGYAHTGAPDGLKCKWMLLLNN